MAIEKLITDYPLRSAVTPEVNFFVDDGTQSYRITAEQLKEFLSPIQIGSVEIYFGETLPARRLWADGSLHNIANYPELFAVYGTKFGGDGINTFGVPDLRDRAVIGRGDMGGVPANRVTNAVSGFNSTVLGAAGGSQSHTLTQAEMPSHTHTQNAHQHMSFNSGSTSGGAATTNATYTLRTQNGLSGNNYTMTGTTNAADVGLSGATTATNQNTGGGGAHRNMQPSMVCNFVIKYI